ncbi:histidine kinase [Saccharomonospora xinjiangensis]|nr:Sensor histidine kinase DesK [Saccharomonospora xinjiangensis]
MRTLRQTSTPGAGTGEGPHPACLNRAMPPQPGKAAHAFPVNAAIPVVLTLAIAIGYLGVDLASSLTEPVAGLIPPVAHAGIVLLQAVALVFRRRAPRTVFAVAVLLDLLILATSAGELGIGALAVIVSAYVLARRVKRTTAHIALAVAAVATTVCGTSAMLTASAPPLTVLVAASARIALLYALPAVVAEYMTGRDRLAQALREREELAERQRRDRAEREIRAERTALARELHDIAGHHLSGIIVSAQAASALTSTDPDRARETLRTLQHNARTALADLRRTVGLLRSDDSDEHAKSVQPPSIDGIDVLVREARARGQRIDYVVNGERRPLGTLAEIAGYRMVQESLANAARHAPGAPCEVRIDFRDDSVELTVRNDAAPSRGQGTVADPGPRRRYGLSGMEERAELINARLITERERDGGWRNQLTIPIATERSGT